MQKKFILKNRFLVVMVLLCLVMQVFNPGRVWSVLLVVLGGLLGICLAWALLLQNGLSIDRQIRFGWAQVGDELEERFILTNRSPLPALWVEVIDLSDLPGHEISRAIGVDASSQTNWRANSICERRGLYTLGPTLLRTGDPFGIFNVEITNPSKLTILVMPPIVSLPKIQIASGGRTGEGRPRQHAVERTVSASGVREFVPGDSLRAIHWPTTVRRQNFFVRVLDSTPTGDWRILVDLNRAVQRGQMDDSSEEHAVILAASLADLSLRQKRVTSLAVNGSPFIWLPGRADESQRWEILRSLALAHPGDLSLAEMLARLTHDLPGNSSLVIITPDTSGDWLLPLMALAWRGVTPTVLLLDPASFPGSPAESGLSRQAQNLRLELEKSQIQSELISRELLNRSDTHPGHAGRWEWRVSGAGRAVAVGKPGDLEWRQL